MVVGFVVGIFGHITKTQGAGRHRIGMIFVATFVLPLGVTSPRA